MNFEAAKHHILYRLENELAKNLYYHGPHHTRDVHKAVIEIGRGEGIEGDELLLLKTAALYHDSGFLETYQNHEAAGCEIVRQKLPGFGYGKAQIEQICAMIMATRIPQDPQDHLAQILCDADLYYLGTDDFFPIGNDLFREFREYGVLSNEEEWNRIQLKFLSSHKYFTQTALHQRRPKKVIHLKFVKELVDSYAA
jgi:uncharacterized protein